MKQTQNWGYIIEKNQDILFQCNQVLEQKKRDYERKFLDVFSEDINALKTEKNTERKKISDCRYQSGFGWNGGNVQEH